MILSPRRIGIAIILLVLAGSAGLAIQVRNTKKIASEALSDVEPCFTSTDMRGCLTERVELLAHEQGSTKALTLLLEKVSHDNRVQGVCHSLTHEVGHVAWSEKKDIALAFQTAGPEASACASGFYHGVIEAAVEEMSPDEIVAKVPTICEPFSNRPESLDHYNCVHGLGHGLFALRRDDWRVALQDCGALTTEWERSSCASGVFMQNVVDELEGGDHVADFREDDPLYPCTATDKQWWTACYLNQSSHVLFISGGDFKPVFAACAKAPDSTKSLCYQSAGRDVAGRYRTNDDVVVEICNSAGSGMKDCIIGVVRDYIYYERGPNAARALCKLMNAETQAACEATIETDIKSL